MRTNLEVPYKDRIEAKQLGAKWDIARKVWYVVDVENMQAFMRWIPDYLKSQHKKTCKK